MAIFYGIVTLYTAALVAQNFAQDVCKYPKELNSYGPYHDKRIPGLRIYRKGVEESKAKFSCSRWGFDLGRLTTYSTFLHRGPKHIATKTDGKCAFAFITKRTRETYMCQVSDRCPTSLQYRVIPAHQLLNCDRSKETWRVEDFIQDPGSKWLLKNNGHELEIQIHPVGSANTVLRNGRETILLPVTKILIKSGTNEKDGSEHSIGIAKHAGELQIFHESHEQFGGKKHALSFMIQERNNPKNRKWNSNFLRHIYRCVEIRSESLLDHSPPSLKDLIFEDLSGINTYTIAQRLSAYIRYDGPSSDSSCENHMWTIFENTIYLNSAQMNILRQLKRDKVVSSSPIKHFRFSNNYCRHRWE